jgi:hypothetical protein
MEGVPMNYGIDLMVPGILILLTMSIYVVIISIFLNGRQSYKGGILEQVINFVIATIGFLLVSDLSLFLVPYYGFNISFSVNVSFKILAMISLAVGGLRLLTK